MGFNPYVNLGHEKSNVDWNFDVNEKGRRTMSYVMCLGKGSCESQNGSTSRRKRSILIIISSCVALGNICEVLCISYAIMTASLIWRFCMLVVFGFGCNSSHLKLV